MRPFRYNYTGAFALSTATEDDFLLLTNELSAEEKNKLAVFLDIPLSPEIRKEFLSHLDKLLKPQMNSYEKIIAILNGFRTFQYELGFDEMVHTKKIHDFLLNTKSGDCTEFSNATAMLSRLAGIPSRVVTGYLASQGMMLPKHKRGLKFLQDQYYQFRKYPLDKLILVTTAHKHSWAQVYIAPFGWLDVETTATAIPPPMGGNANDWNLVVPRKGKVVGKPSEPAPFPWLTLLLVTGIVIASGVVLLYVVKYMRLLILALISRRNSLRGLRALQKLLLMKLIVRGYKYKPPSKTILDYASVYPELKTFAEYYTELRYHGSIRGEDAFAVWQLLRQENAAINRATRKASWKKGGFWREIFSPEGFRY
jgi:hypothetical protein